MVIISRAYLTLTGGFEPGRRYRITVPETVLSKDGRALGKEVSVSVNVPDYPSRIAFQHSRGFLSHAGSANLCLAITAVNCDAMSVMLSNLTTATSSGIRKFSFRIAS